MDTTTESELRIEHGFLGGWAQGMLSAWNEHDADAIASLCSDDIVWEDPAMPDPLRGRDAVHDFASATFRVFPDFHIEAATLFSSPTDSCVLAPYRMSGTMLGRWSGTIGKSKAPEIAPTNAHFSIAGVDQWTFRDELICRYSTCYDGLALARQLGLLPASGSVGERAILPLQRLRARFQRRAATRR